MDPTQQRDQCPIMLVGPARVRELDFATRSLSEAAEQFHNNARRLRAEADFAAHRDTIIIGVTHGRNHVEFMLSDDTVLRIFLQSGTMGWSLDRVGNRELTNDGDMPATVDLLWRDKPPLWRWERVRLLESRIGRRASFFSAGQVNLYFYCEGYPILSFDPLMDFETGQEFLFWCETN